MTITDSNGCEYTDDIKVCIKEDTFKPVSIITPNGDGKTMNYTSVVWIILVITSLLYLTDGEIPF